MWVHTVLALTNIIAVLPIRAALHSTKHPYRIAFIVCGAMMSSIGMHLAETKHDLNPGPYLKPWSLVLLNCDRLFSILAGVMGVSLWILIWIKTRVWMVEPLWVMGIACMCSAIGEYTNNLKLYVTLHTIWHFCAYVSLFLVIRKCNSLIK